MRLIKKSGLRTGKCTGGIFQDLSQIYRPYDWGMFLEGMSKFTNQGHPNLGSCSDIFFFGYKETQNLFFWANLLFLNTNSWPKKKVYTKGFKVTCHCEDVAQCVRKILVTKIQTTWTHKTYQTYIYYSPIHVSAVDRQLPEDTNEV